MQHTTSITCLAVTPDGSLIASASPPPPESSSGSSVTTAQISLWDVATAACLHVMHHHSCGVQVMLTAVPLMVCLAPDTAQVFFTVSDLQNFCVMTDNCSIQKLSKKACTVKHCCTMYDKLGHTSADQLGSGFQRMTQPCGKSSIQSHHQFQSQSHTYEAKLRCCERSLCRVTAKPAAKLANLHRKTPFSYSD